MEETITSELARKIARDNTHKSIRDQIESIDKKILESANKNNFFCYIYHNISKSVKNDLKERGFIVEDMSRFSENFFKIYW